MLVDDFLDASARLRPDKVALVCGERRLTYAEIADASARFASGLARLGVARGDRVVVQLDNSVEAVVAIFGILKARAVFVPVGRTVKSDKLAYILGDCQARVLIAERRAGRIAREASARAGVDIVILAGDPQDNADGASDGALRFDEMLSNEPATIPRGIDLDLAALIYTSGSTGQPKGVMLTHVNIVSAATSISAYLQNREDDVVLDVLPLSFDYGLYQLFLTFKAGARLVLERSFVYATVMLDLLVKERVTGLPIVPMLAVLLLKHDLSAYDLSLRYITNTGAVLPPTHIAKLRSRFPHVRIFSMYGLTECKRVSYLPPEEIDARPTSVGKPMDNVEVFVADELGCLHTTGVGELVIRGSNVMQGYWRAKEATEAALKPGVLPGERLLSTGDRFRIDAEGYMYFQGRLDDLIKSRGQRVSPKEVENVIYELRGVAGVAVVGVPDEMRGNYIKAFVCLDSGHVYSQQDVIRHCSHRLEDFMVPRAVQFVDALPCTDSGKLRRPAAGAEPAASPSVPPA